MNTYELKTLSLPKLSGKLLLIFTWLMENPLFRSLLIGNLLENGGIPKLRRKKILEEPTFKPLVKPLEANSKSMVEFKPIEQETPFPFTRTRDYHAAYKNGLQTPIDIAEKVLKAIDLSEKEQPALCAFIAINREDVMRQAEQSTHRWKNGTPLSWLDGVPIAIKDELDMKPYPTHVGTCFLGEKPVEYDSTVVAKLRAAGAILVGKTNMHEIGINPNGYNLHYGAARNPYNPNHDSGGSSSGSAVAVAAGLVPIAIGADGGGSIRIPAGLCGIVGIKPTFGRVSEFGSAPLCWSVAHNGPLAACVEDLVITYSTIAGKDEKDSNTQFQPVVTIGEWQNINLSGVRLGVYKDWFEHAHADIVTAGYEMLEKLKKAGAVIKQILIPELDEMRIAHAITILSEMAASMKLHKENRHLHGAAVRLSLALGETFTAADYIQAQRMRTRAMHFFSNVFKEVDAIISPVTALPSQPYPRGGLKYGYSDLSTETETMRYVFASNLCGHPAISFPVGYNKQGLPLGMQAISPHWREDLLFRIAFCAEKQMERRIPQRFYKIL